MKKPEAVQGAFRRIILGSETITIMGLEIALLCLNEEKPEADEFEDKPCQGCLRRLQEKYSKKPNVFLTYTVSNPNLSLQGSHHKHTEVVQSKPVFVPFKVEDQVAREYPEISTPEQFTEATTSPESCGPLNVPVRNPITKLRITLRCSPETASLPSWPSRRG